MNSIYEAEDDEQCDDKEDEEYLPEEPDKDESQINGDEDGLIGDDHDTGSPTEEGCNESMDDNGRNTQDEI